MQLTVQVNNGMIAEHVECGDVIISGEGVRKDEKGDTTVNVDEDLSMAMLSAGHKAIAIPSATLLKTEDMKPIADMIGQGWKGSLHIYPDRDEAGERLYQNLLKTATQIGVYLVRHELKEGCKDFGEMWKVEN